MDRSSPKGDSYLFGDVWFSNAMSSNAGYGFVRYCMVWFN